MAQTYKTYVSELTGLCTPLYLCPEMDRWHLQYSLTSSVEWHNDGIILLATRSLVHNNSQHEERKWHQSNSQTLSCHLNGAYEHTNVHVE